jgi:hypothetical protein
VPRNLISQRVKIPPVLFTRIGAEANSGRVSLVRGDCGSIFDKTFFKSFLKSLRRSSARSASEPEVGCAKRRPSAYLGKFKVSMGTEKRDITIGG